MTGSRPTLALTQGDPAGIGPEILAKLLVSSERSDAWRPLLIVEQAALETLPAELFDPIRDRLDFLPDTPSREEVDSRPIDRIMVIDPVQSDRTIEPGRSGPADAGGAIAALDVAVSLAESGAADAVVTCPISKQSVARHHLSSFRGHTDYLASKVGLISYGRDYLMAFLAPDLQVALLTAHLPLAEAINSISTESIEAALGLLDRVAGGRIAVAGLNPHAGENGLIGTDDLERVAPAVSTAREKGVDAVGPESADSVFARARRGEFDWVLALYHDQGLIAVKTAAFGRATNWTLGLPFLRTSVDHGTAFELAGRNLADARPLEEVVATTLRLLAGDLPSKRVC